MPNMQIIGGALTITDDGRELRVEHVHVGGPIGWVRPGATCSGTWTTGAPPSPMPAGFRLEREKVSGRDTGRWRCVPQTREVTPMRESVISPTSAIRVSPTGAGVSRAPMARPLSNLRTTGNTARKVLPNALGPLSPGGGAMHTVAPQASVYGYPPPDDVPPPAGVMPGACGPWQGPTPPEHYAEIPTAPVGAVVQIWQQPGVSSASLWWRACALASYSANPNDPNAQQLPPPQLPPAQFNPNAQSTYGQPATYGYQDQNQSWDASAPAQPPRAEQGMQAQPQQQWSSESLGALLENLDSPGEPVTTIDDLLSLIEAQWNQGNQGATMDGPSSFDLSKSNAAPQNDGQLPPTGENGVSLFQPKIDGNAAGSSIWDPQRPDVPGAGVLAPRSLLTEKQRREYPSIGSFPVIGACSCVHRADLTSEQYGKIGDFWGDFTNGLSTADHVFDQLWQVVKPVVPYGQIIDQVHQARMDAMYGAQPAPGSSAPQLPSPVGPTTNGQRPGTFRGMTAGEAKTFGRSVAPILIDRTYLAIHNAQDVTRRARKKDPIAQAEIVRVKEAAAAGDPVARRLWRVMALVMQDDDQRIATGQIPSALGTLSSGSPSASSSALATAVPASLPSPRGPAPSPSAPAGVPFGGSIKSGFRFTPH